MRIPGGGGTYITSLVTSAVKQWATSQPWLHGRMAIGQAELLCCCQVVVESVPMPGNGTNVSLVYASNRAPGYKSTLVLRLTSDHSPVNLTTVHVYVSVEGRQTRRMFAARPNLRYTFTWNRLNAYRQKVYGRATAIGTWPTFTTSEFLRATALSAKRLLAIVETSLFVWLFMCSSHSAIVSKQCSSGSLNFYFWLLERLWFQEPSRVD